MNMGSSPSPTSLDPRLLPLTPSSCRQWSDSWGLFSLRAFHGERGGWQTAGQLIWEWLWPREALACPALQCENCCPTPQRPCEKIYSIDGPGTRGVFEKHLKGPTSWSTVWAAGISLAHWALGQPGAGGSLDRRPGGICPASRKPFLTRFSHSWLLND